MSRDPALRLGFIALDDAATMIVAKARGYFEDEGLNVALSREVSWATVRDKVKVGALDGAHMLAPTALAVSLGVGGDEPTALLAPFALNLNGPAITLSSHIADVIGPDPTAEGLARLIARRRDEGASALTLAVVFPFSTHNYLLRDWLARSGIDPDRDVRLTVAPPSRMTELLVGGVVEGFCVTEPWNAAAVAAGAGRIVVRASTLWPRAPDKVFAVTQTWADANPERLQAILRALLRAAAWADAAENRPLLAELLSEAAHVGASREVIEASLTDIVLYAKGANVPEPIHAAWLAAQMVRWGHIPRDVDVLELAARVYRPDLLAVAAAELGLPTTQPLVVLDGYDLQGPFRRADARRYAQIDAEARTPKD